MAYMYADYQIVYSGIQQVANNLPYYSAECKLHIHISLARAVNCNESVVWFLTGF